jgi:hypothetical protein
MEIRQLSIDDEAAVRQVLEGCWSGRTSVCFNPAIAPRSYGQCAPTAVVIFEQFGGEILKTEATRFDGFKIPHYYNCIGGRRYDFTADQFNVPDYIKEFTYKDVPSSVEEAETEMMSGQLDAMRAAFSAAIRP